jgi:hypothetical protein
MKYFLFIQTNSDLHVFGDQNVVSYKIITKEKMPMIFSNYLYKLNFKQYEIVKNFKKTCEMTKKDFFVANKIEELLI